ncbi:MAG: hypothetical protein ALAOOOJD_00352 [bacterium]|nr:hypothetical protein [bacterium]
MEFAEIIFHLILLLFIVYLAVVVLLLLFFASAKFWHRQSGKLSLFQQIKQKQFPEENAAGAMLNLAWRVLFHAVLFAAFIALLIDIKVVELTPLLATLVGVILLTRLAEVFIPGAETARHYRRDEDQSKVTSWIIGLSFFTNLLAPILESRYKLEAAALPVMQWWNWVGLLLFAAGSALRLWAFYQAGSVLMPHVKVEPKHKLVTGGPYASVRHPSYLGLMISYLGIAILFQSMIGAIALVVLVIPAIVWRLTKEEQLLASRLGETWKKYQAQTPARLIPKVW